jgi:hypothetical protein
MDSYIAYGEDGVSFWLGPRVGEGLAQCKVGIDSKEALTKCDKTGDVEDPSQVKVMEVQPIVVHHPPKERMS